MSMRGLRFSAIFILGWMFVSGCATTRAHKPDANTQLNQELVQMQATLQAKDLEIQELKAQLESYDRSLQGAYTSARSQSQASAAIRVPGVTGTDVQRALARAGLDPGPIDGRVGKKTKMAIREFQRRHNLKADGVVGDKTWALLG